MIQTKRLDPASFGSFGHVARRGEGLTRSIRAGEVVLTRSPACFPHDHTACDHSLDFYEVQPASAPFRAVQAEQHPNSAQMFVPMRARAYLVLVWEGDPRDGAPAHAFVAGPEDVVIYNPGQWHHGIVALGAPALFASTMWRTRGGVDVEFAPLDAPLAVDLADHLP
ncbi:MAG: ureidoglycolate lyase [Rhodobacteraceae bacterium]|nr:ureidoglycolate lyase [Paracoccaceae bacterium]